MKKIKQALRRFISLTLVFALVLDQNIVNAHGAAQQTKPDGQSSAVQTEITRETQEIDPDSQDKNADEETDETGTEMQTEAAFVNEITDGRSENSKQYLMSDKSVTVVMYDEAVHFEDESGNLVEIDNSLIKTDDGYTNGANTYDAVFHDDDEARGKVDFSEDGYGISWQLLETNDTSSSNGPEDTDWEENRQSVYAYRENRAARAAAESETADEDASDTEKTADSEEGADTDKAVPKEDDGAQAVKAVAADSEISDITDYEDEKEFGYAAKQSSILFDGFTNDISIEYIPQNDGIKENIIMNNKTADYVHRFSISLKGLTASLTDENEIIFYDAETGEQKYYFPAPYMVDADGNISYNVRYQIGEEEESSTGESGSEESSTGESSSEEGSTEENSTEENSSEENSTGENSSEESSTEENSTEESSTGENSTEESSAKEDSAEEESDTKEQSTKKESAAQDTSKEEKGTGTSGQKDQTQQEAEEEGAAEPENEKETSRSMVLSSINGPTLSGSAGSPAKESEEALKENPRDEAIKEEKPEADESKAPEEKPETGDKEETPGADKSREPEEKTSEHLEKEAEPETEEGSGTEAESGSEPNGQDSGAPKEDQTVTISIIPDSEWLETAQYPVTIDPLLKKVNGAKEITKVSINNTNTTRDTTTLRVGIKNGAIYRSFVRFDLPTLPKNCIITNAELTSASGSSDGTLYIEAHMLGRAWQPGTISWSNQPKSGNRLLDYAQNYSYFNITKAVREWYEGTSPNYGIGFKAYDETLRRSKTISFKSSKTKPYLKLNYIAAGGTENYWTTHQAAAGTAGAAYINDYLGYLTVVNADVQTAGTRMPMDIRHVYNSCQTDTDIGAGYGWRLNYQQTLKIPADTADVTEYPYVWTDEDGTQHYFKKKGVTILQNGGGKSYSSTAAVPSAADEDGLGLYVVPVSDVALKKLYPLKLTDKSGSVCRYFDKMGRLALIADSNQYENKKNSSSKEQNCIQITYENAGAKADTTAYDEALAKLKELKAAYDKKRSLDECTRVYNNVIPYMEKLRRDVYAVSDYATGKKVCEAYTAVETAEDATSYNVKKAQAKKAIDAVTKAKGTAAALKTESGKRMKSVTDAVGNTAVISYDRNGRISAITNPSAPNNGNYNKNASAKHTYQYTDGNLTGIGYSDGRSAAYTYDARRNLTQMRDYAGYRVNYAYNDRNRVTQVSETGSSNAAGQKYTIAYHSDKAFGFYHREEYPCVQTFQSEDCEATGG